MCLTRLWVVVYGCVYINLIILLRNLKLFTLWGFMLMCKTHFTLTVQMSNCDLFTHIPSSSHFKCLSGAFAANPRSTCNGCVMYIIYRVSIFPSSLLSEICKIALSVHWYFLLTCLDSLSTERGCGLRFPACGEQWHECEAFAAH